MNEEAMKGYDACEVSAEPQYSPKRRIEIDPLDYGYVVRVGCQTCAIESKSDLIKHLTEYLSDPLKVEEKYNQKEYLKYQKAIINYE